MINMKPINVINIVEICDDGCISCLYDYDKLPQNVKTKVDEAIKNDNGIDCDIYADGLQFLSSIKHPTLLENKILVTNFIGTVEFYHYC